LASRSLPSNQIKEREADYWRRLQERYYKNEEARKSDRLALEAESGGTSAELAKLEEEGMEAALLL
ncbi:unnamed protein product, partial [marine sediment metagenome]